MSRETEAGSRLARPFRRGKFSPNLLSPITARGWYEDSYVA